MFGNAQMLAQQALTVAQDALTVANKGLTKIDQHMHDCENRAAAVTKRLDDQDRGSNEKHKQNTDRMDTISDKVEKASTSARNRYLVIITTLFISSIGMVGTLAIELAKVLK